MLRLLIIWIMRSGRRDALIGQDSYAQRIHFGRFAKPSTSFHQIAPCCS